MRLVALGWGTVRTTAWERVWHTPTCVPVRFCLDFGPDLSVFERGHRCTRVGVQCQLSASVTWSGSRSWAFWYFFAVFTKHKWVFFCFFQVIQYRGIVCSQNCDNTTYSWYLGQNCSVMITLILRVGLFLARRSRRGVFPFPSVCTVY